MRNYRQLLTVCFIAIILPVQAQVAEQVIDIPTRASVTQRMLVLAPTAAKATVVLFAGGNGGLRITPNGSMLGGSGNFLVRTRQQFAAQGLVVAVVDAPSDHQTSPYLGGFRETSEHVADIKAVIAWLRDKYKLPVWLVGTSRGTQSAAYATIELASADGPDGLVLTSTILTDRRARAVPLMALDKIRGPVLVVHHEQDGCPQCAFSQVPYLMSRLTHASRKQMLSFKGGQNDGDPCGPSAHHGYNGIEGDVVPAIAAWILAV